MLHITSNQEFEELINNNDKIIIDFYATWCGPCKMLAPIIEKLELDNPSIKFVKVDVDQADELASMFAIYSIPTLAYIQNKNLLKKEEGFKDLVSLQTNINTLFK